MNPVTAYTVTLTAQQLANLVNSLGAVYLTCGFVIGLLVGVLPDWRSLFSRLVRRLQRSKAVPVESDVVDMGFGPVHVTKPAQPAGKSSSTASEA